MGKLSDAYEHWLFTKEKLVLSSLKNAVEHFYSKEADTLFSSENEFRASEMCMAGCLHYYLKKDVDRLRAEDDDWRAFGPRNVDVEYNLMVFDGVVEAKNFFCKHCEGCRQNSCMAKKSPLEADQNGNRHFRPDIVVHNRRENSHNLLMVEVKVGSDDYFVDEGNCVVIRTTPALTPDFSKLCLARCHNGEYKYAVGCSLVLDQSKAFLLEVAPCAVRNALRYEAKGMTWSALSVRNDCAE